MLAAPWVLAHSAKRAVNELPIAGFKRAPPRENANQIKTMKNTSKRTAATRRRRYIRRRFARIVMI
jgi:hypothetical protein